MHVLRLAFLAVAACGFLSAAAASDTTDAISTQIEQLKESEAQLELIKAALEAKEGLEIKSFAATADSGSGSSSQSVEVSANDSANSEYAIEPLPTRASSSSSASASASSSGSATPSSSSGSSATEEVVATPTPTPTSSDASSLVAPTTAVLTSAVVYVML